jgi:hypothetical protein
MLTVVKPSPLRLWGFLLTVVGGAAIAFGSIGDWAVVSLGGSTAGAVPTKGIDVWQGWVTVFLGVSIVVAILALRFVRPDRRAASAVAIVALALLALGLSIWCVLALDDIVRDPGVESLIALVVQELGLPETEARRLVVEALGTTGIDVRAQAGLWITLGGAAVATVGGLVDLAWVREKRRAGDAIDPDTSTASPAGATERPDDR